MNKKLGIGIASAVVVGILCLVLIMSQQGPTFPLSTKEVGLMSVTPLELHVGNITDRGTVYYDLKFSVTNYGYSHSISSLPFGAQGKYDYYIHLIDSNGGRVDGVNTRSSFLWIDYKYTIPRKTSGDIYFVYEIPADLGIKSIALCEWRSNCKEWKINKAPVSSSPMPRHHLKTFPLETKQLGDVKFTPVDYKEVVTQQGEMICYLNMSVVNYGDEDVNIIDKGHLADIFQLADYGVVLNSKLGQEWGEAELSFFPLRGYIEIPADKKQHFFTARYIVEYGGVTGIGVYGKDVIRWELYEYY